MIKHFVTDLDGTLLNSKCEWDSRIAYGVNRIIESGCDFVVATGRGVNGIKKCQELWELPVYLIIMNGAVILDPQRKVIFSKNISLQSKRQILKYWSNENIEYILFDKILTKLDEKTYLSEYSKWDMWREKVLYQKESGYFDTYMNQITFNATDEIILKSSVLKINGLQLNSDRYKRMLQQMPEIVSDIENSPFSDNVIEITAANVSKANALLKICENLNWNEEEIAVFGDGGNDIEMLKSFRNSFAPYHAMEETKHIANTVLEEGEYRVIEKMLELLCN